MLSLRILAIGICLTSAMVPSLTTNAVAKNFPLRLAQMTTGVCWDTCSTPCYRNYEKCAEDTTLSPLQRTGCRTIFEACHSQCRDQCGLKK